MINFGVIEIFKPFISVFKPVLLEIKLSKFVENVFELTIFGIPYKTPKYAPIDRMQIVEVPIKNAFRIFIFYDISLSFDKSIIS